MLSVERANTQFTGGIFLPWVMVKVFPAIVIMQLLDIVSGFAATSIATFALLFPEDGDTETKLQLAKEVQEQLAALVRFTFMVC